jgi:hypothetical protein
MAAVVEIDEVLHHVLDRLGSRIHNVNFEVVTLHHLGSVLVNKAVVIQALLR